MPVLLADEHRDIWLSSDSSVERLNECLTAPPEDWLTCYPVDAKLVNSALVDQPECLNEIDVDWQSLLKPAIRPEETPGLMSAMAPYTRHSCHLQNIPIDWLLTTACLACHLSNSAPQQLLVRHLSGPVSAARTCPEHGEHLGRAVVSGYAVIRQLDLGLVNTRRLLRIYVWKLGQAVLNQSGALKWVLDFVAQFHGENKGGSGQLGRTNPITPDGA